ncbi:hypothetical protein S7711_11541 [Stachybotrys chartarum IBT 7711]|uniref:Uncharacterized protein n=1 Tax=Stachybotrys chartarum (strain CBS 109288 / IBT 7711) TaxID=1280523 RepID=A0A084AEZ1_STACB|nr:hypothetical protein S7711_11541 [Stachybotrys chartarum IBT 7711]
MAFERAPSTSSDALAHIKWEFPGDIDTTSLRLLATWAKDPDTWTTFWEDDGVTTSSNPVATEQEIFDCLNERMLRLYTEMKDRSPALTLNLAAQLIIVTRCYLEDTHLRMLNLYVHHEGGYHGWAADALDNGAGPFEGCLEAASLCLGTSQRRHSTPLPNRWEDLGDLRDTLVALSKHLATAEQALLPHIAEIERVACTGDMWTPKVVDVDSPVESPSPSGFIKIRDEHGCEADLFVTTRQRRLPERCAPGKPHRRLYTSTVAAFPPIRRHYQIAPGLHSVEMPKAAWHTVARVAAVLRPHQGRHSNIKDILAKPRWRSDGPWLEKEMEAFFQRVPETNPARLLVDNVRRARLLDRERWIRTRGCGSVLGSTEVKN